MVCAKKVGGNGRRNGVERLDSQSGVISKLINKAEKRQKTAENFLIYAVMQSTICKLKMDDMLYQVSCTEPKDFDKRSLVRSRRSHSVEKRVENYCAQDDPLHLDSFFDKLRTDHDRSCEIV